MKFKETLQSKEFVKKARFFSFAFVFIMAIILVVGGALKIEAAVITEISGTKFDKDNDGAIEDTVDYSEIFNKYDFTYTDDEENNYSLSYIQGNGKEDETAVIFKIKNFPSKTTAFMIVEEKESDSEGENADADRYTKGIGYKQNNLGTHLKVGNEYYVIFTENLYTYDSANETYSPSESGTWLKIGDDYYEVEAENRYNQVDIWQPSESNKTVGLLTGTANMVIENDDSITMNITYRLRDHTFGLKSLLIYFYDSKDFTANAFASHVMYYVIAQPVDLVSHETSACTGNVNTDTLATICTDYTNTGSEKEPQKMKIYMPQTVAYLFKAIGGTTDVENNSLTNYLNPDYSTIYAINYFTEDATGSVEPTNKTTAAAKSYLYTNFIKYALGKDTQDTYDVMGENNGYYANYLGSYVINKLGYFETEVDATGRYYIYITDVFGNVKEFTQDVTNVKNRSIETLITKSNAVDGQSGYDAEETFTNESVMVSIAMKVQTNFEYGMCLNEKCVAVINLTADNVEHIKYWRVDVEFTEEGEDLDGFEEGDPISDNYATEGYADNNMMYNLYCRTSVICTDAQTYDSTTDDLTKEDTAGFVSFEGNVLKMYVGLNGRYRFYIEDIYGNHTLGSTSNVSERTVGEYRNPRVEVYAIDKQKPDIVFEHDGGYGSYTAFNLETYKYYSGVGLPASYNHLYEDLKKNQTDDAVAETISSYVYYPSNRITGKQTADVEFNDDDAKNLSHVRVEDNVYFYYNETTKELFADYSVYDLGEGEGQRDVAYKTYGYDNSRATMIKMNNRNSSTGLKVENDIFAFNSITYYHENGTTGVCEYLQDVLGADYSFTTQLQCVNYYIDHGVSFIIEFTAEDAVGNIASEKVYVNVVDTTTPGFTAYDDEDSKIKLTNINTECRMEIGQKIGKDQTQDKEAILKCYNVILNNAYNFEDNKYEAATNSGLTFKNTVNSANYVKLYMLSDDGETWLDLSRTTFIPNKTGYYDMKIELYDQANNKLTLIVSYYVDKKIVLFEPIATSKNYGQDDATLEYCVYIDQGNNSAIRFSNNPYSNLTIFTKVYCSNWGEEEKEKGLSDLFQNNEGTSITGSLSRLESIWYNGEKEIYYDEAGKIGVENNYVGLYRIILGTLNISVETTVDDETVYVEDPDYIVKIHPGSRDATKYKGTENGNLIIDPVEGLECTDCDYLDNSPLEDDNGFTQSSIDFTINQIVITVTANGGSKNYGDKDVNFANYNNDTATSKYLNGFSVTGLITTGQYGDSQTVVLGVLRRQIGENVGIYAICNYRGTDFDDKTLETTNNMYLDCDDQESSEIVFGGTYEYQNGIIKINEDYMNSRALYIATNRAGTAGRTLNVEPDNLTRNNTYANYVINYAANTYTINSIDLVVQAAPGQRREYSLTNVDPNPWEIILYGLVEDNIVSKEDGTFNGYTATADTYTASANDTSEVALLEANLSESRCTNDPDDGEPCDEAGWKIIHDGKTLTGTKTNQTYKLLRSAVKDSVAGSAKLVRPSGINGGWYLYYTLANDLNVNGVTASGGDTSSIAVITNNNSHCSYDETGHIVTVNGSAACKNYNLIYNPYYTNEEGYTFETKTASHVATNGIYKDFVYKSNGMSCLELDEDLPCTNTEAEPNKIYKIQFEIYRREIIMEFNSAIETLTIGGNNVDVVYGNRYKYYYDNYLDVESYSGNGVNKTLYAEDYLFICYQKDGVRSSFDTSSETSAAATGCSGDPKYGLVGGDSWTAIGLNFELHTLVSASGSGYYSDSDKAIPAGVYYVYADIAEEQKLNYNFNYLGGSMTIKSKTVELVITSYTKEYGEAHYISYGEGNDYSGYAKYTTLCFVDGLILNSNDTLINLGKDADENPIYCHSATDDISNTVKNIYGFYVNGLDDKDVISNNFAGRPKRNRSVTAAADVNGLQENVGVYTIAQGSIATILNNPFVLTNSCGTQIVEGEYGDCVLALNKEINNYVIKGEPRSYVFDMQGINDITSSNAITETPTVKDGKLFILPAELKITVTTNQTKMYGCSYNTVNTSDSVYGYNYNNGYSNCVETDGSYYDLGYEYKVEGDKDYQIARNGYSYTSNDSYTVSGILGSTTFRPTTYTTGIKAHALNTFGTLYRIDDTETNRTQVLNASNASGAASTQLTSGKTYQGQGVGNYIITLGNVDAAVNANIDDKYANTCDAQGNPVVDGIYACKNYTIDYYSTKVYNTSATDNDVTQEYKNADDEFPTELIFTITKRTVYVYTDYDQKIYGDADQDVTYKCGDYNMNGVVDDAGDKVLNENDEEVNADVYYGFCTQRQVDLNKDNDETNDVDINYGLTRYYTKYNSLAKAPWSADTTDKDNDVQTDIVSGKISREGMKVNGETKSPTTDDIVGHYKYVYNSAKFGGTVDLTTYGKIHYNVNFYNNDTDKLAVDINGNVEYEGIVDGEEAVIQVKFEIVLRRIKIGFKSFSKIYGDADNVTNYDILVCAPSESFDFVNMECVSDGVTVEKHGLSAAHKNKYYDEDGDFKQALFKSDFIVRFKRVLGENVSCGTSPKVEITLNGYFFGDKTEITIELACGALDGDNPNEYETLAYIDQSSSSYPGYNYQVEYHTGYVDITPRPITITPVTGQGFMYGDYDDTLLPAIKFNVTYTNDTDKIGLVNDKDSDTDGICLVNIDYYNNDEGTCFNVNDRQDTYDAGGNYATSAYVSSSVKSDKGLNSIYVINYPFGDMYSFGNEHGDGAVTRSALSKTMLVKNDGTYDDQRYNRNAGTYKIVLGDLADKTGNYQITFTNNVTYKINHATVLITPESTVYSGTTQENQYKIYGEQDKELTFSTQTSYSITSSHYVKYNSNILQVCPNDADCKTLSQLQRYKYSTETKIFVTDAEGDYIYLTRGDVVKLKGYAYDENGNVENLNYGVVKQSNKNNLDATINQANVKTSYYYDIAYKNLPENVGWFTDTGALSYGDTDRVLLGYLYVEGWAQAAGTYKIANGMVVADNEFSVKNYEISYVSDVDFTIIPRPIGLQIAEVNKIYGQATDIISCDTTIETCSLLPGILMEGESYLKYNFSVDYFSTSTRLESVLKTESYDNTTLYSQNGKYVNGLADNANYSAYEVSETKNSEYLGVYVSRDETDGTNDCLYANDKYGFCEDVGSYALRFYGYVNTTDKITKDDYASTEEGVIAYKPTTALYTDLVESVEQYYYDMYWGYNPNYFVVVVESDTVTKDENDNDVITEGDVVLKSQLNTTITRNTSSVSVIKSTASLNISKKSVGIYVNTSFHEDGLEIYYVQQNTRPPSLPLVNNTDELDYTNFEDDREDAVGGTSTYGDAIWGKYNSQVRTGDQLVGEVAYCDVILTSTQYDAILASGLTSDYSCSNVLYEDNKNSLNTNLEGYVPIIRQISKLSIVSKIHTSPDASYETKNYTTTFYPGALRIEEDDTKPVIEVTRDDIYLEANAVGTYSYDCINSNGSTTYGDCDGLTLVGKNQTVTDDPILKWLSTTANYELIVKASLPQILDCETNEYDCTASAYYELMHGKGNGEFDGIVAGTEEDDDSVVNPFTMEQAGSIKNDGPSNMKELILTLVSWFGATAYDEGEVRNNIKLDKNFDKYWYILIEKTGTNGDFHIARTGEYKVHFYVMDNAGNVSEGNVESTDTYDNVGTLHIIDTSKPIVGTINLYNAEVECKQNDCTNEDNWTVRRDTYLPLNTFIRYDSNGIAKADGGYIMIDKDRYVAVAGLTLYNELNQEDELLGNYVKVTAGTSALVVKHYTWSSSKNGIWMTITGGSDNSYTETSFENAGSSDYSQWNQYYSRDGGITWFLYDRAYKTSVNVLNNDGTREILLKAVDEGIKITDLESHTETYYTKYYGAAAEPETVDVTVYTYTDSKYVNDWLKDTDSDNYDESLVENYLPLVGWNVSDWAEVDETISEDISMKIYGYKAFKDEGDDEGVTVSNYKYYRDKQIAYLDTTAPVVSIGSANGEDIYTHEYGCDTCTEGYTEKFVGARDSYPLGSVSRESESTLYNLNNSFVINHTIFDVDDTNGYQGSYENIVRESLTVKREVSGLSNSIYPTTGTDSGKDIRDIYYEQRRFIIYAFDDTGAGTVHDLSHLIPTTSVTNAEGYSLDAIYAIIPHVLTDYSGGDYSYIVRYSVIDKAGNESVSAARGINIVDLSPDIRVNIENQGNAGDEGAEGDENIEQVAYEFTQEGNNYYLNVEQGTDVISLLSNFNVSAGKQASEFINQTIYYNGELLQLNKRYNPLIHKDFTTSQPGVYEITYSYQYYSLKYDEMVVGKPITLTINVEATAPIVEKISNNINYSNLIIMMCVAMGAMFIFLASFKRRKI